MPVGKTVEIDFQALFNASIGIVGAAGGFAAKTVWKYLQELREQDNELTERIHKVETLVAGNYITRNEHDRMTDALFRKLDRIEQKIDSKQDKT